MSENSITKLDAARRQLNSAIRLRLNDGDSLAVHTLSYAAYGILRDLCCARRREVKEVLDAIIDDAEFAKHPNFLKHADRDPEGMLNAHSPETTHLTVALAIWLWKELEGNETPEMIAFSQLPDPYKAEHKASECLKYFQGSALAEQDEDAKRSHLQRILNSPST